jgi:hypothetical protein
MKLTHLTIATAAVTLLGGAAYAQQPQAPAAPAPGSAQYQDKTVGEAAPATADALPPAPTGSATQTAPAAPAAGADVSATTFTNMTVTNGPVPDTAENRAKYGQPLSRAGKRTAARGN